MIRTNFFVRMYVRRYILSHRKEATSVCVDRILCFFFGLVQLVLQHSIASIFSSIWSFLVPLFLLPLLEVLRHSPLPLCKSLCSSVIVYIYEWLHLSDMTPVVCFHLLFAIHPSLHLLADPNQSCTRSCMNVWLYETLYFMKWMTPTWTRNNNFSPI